MNSFIYCSQSKADFIERLGDVVQVVNPASAFFISYGKSDFEGFKQITSTTMLNTFLTHSLKFALNDVYVAGTRLGERPNGSDYNFPSGHMSSAFSAAWHLQKRYGFKYSALPFIGATFVGYSRIHSDRHDLKAVLAGALVGFVSAELFTDKFKDEGASFSVGSDSKGNLRFSFDKRF